MAVSEIMLERIKKLQAESPVIKEALTHIKLGFRPIFLEVLDDELDHDQILELAEIKLNEVYEEWARQEAPEIMRDLDNRLKDIGER